MTAEAFLNAVEQAKPIDARRIAVVVAHPDDETIGCGALLDQLDGATLVVVTDGAPRDLRDAVAHGFATADDYRKARARELREALAGVHLDALIELGLADQTAALHLASLAMRLEDLFRSRKIDVILTHAYEGGHPDHDAAAFAVHAAAMRTGAAVLEMPYYREGPGGTVYQTFLGTHADQTVVILSAESRIRKARMIAAHATQEAVLRAFSLAQERFRVAPAYDFRALPNGGAVHYNRQQWGFHSDQWRAAVMTARKDLGSWRSAS